MIQPRIEAISRHIAEFVYSRLSAATEDLFQMSKLYNGEFLCVLSLRMRILYTI